MMHTTRFALIVLMGLLTSAAPAQFLGGGATTRVDGRLVWQEQPIVAGERAMLGIVLDLARGWHIQAGEGSGDEQPPYVATTVDLDLPEGWSAGEVRWPKAHSFTLGAGEVAETLRGYEGRILVAVPVTIPPNAIGEQEISAEIEYQACDDSVCEMPTSLQLRTSFNVVEPSPELERTPTDGVAALFEQTLAASAERAGPTVTFDEGERVKLDLAWYEVQVSPGSEAHLGVVLHLAPTWHIQAGEGSGDVGEDLIATTIDVDLPEGWSAGEIRWPEAHDFTIGEGEFAINGAGYKGTTLAVVPVTVPEDAEPGEHPIAVRVSYQACDDAVCEMPTEKRIEGKATVIAPGAEVPPLDDRLARMFEDVLARAADSGATDVHVDKVGVDIGAIRWWIALGFLFAAMLWMTVRSFMISSSAITKTIVLVAAAAVSYGGFSFVRAVTAENEIWTYYSEEGFEEVRGAGDQTILIKFTADWCANCQVNERIIMADDEAVGLLGSDDVTAFKVDFTGPNPEGDRKKEELGGGGIPLIAVYRPGEEPVTIRGQLVSADIVVNALQGESVQQVSGERVFDFLNWQFTVGEDATLLILALAFLAGFFMNFTPCVLPVIPLKIISLQTHAKDPKRCFALGVVFSLGIIALYAALGVLIAGLITGIEKMDWGDQFQNWWFSGAIGLVVGAMGFGMLGLFAIRLPQWLYMFNPQSETASGSFFMGVFTAILSTPCTGPLLGATIAWVATQPSIIAFLTLLVMGVGMAFPYVLLTAKPAWLERLPRTGPGSELVKQVMGLLLLAVATWFLGTAALSFSARGEASATSGEEQTMIAVAHDRTASCADQFDSPGYRAITSPKLRS